MKDHKGYNRIKRFKLDEVLPFIGTSNHAFCIGDKSLRVKKLSTQRMLLIKRTQCCEVCRIQATHFWLESAGCFGPHFNIYAENHHGHESMLTMDHILPRSKGGSTSQENIQLLCRDCNRVKKNYLITNEDILRLRFREDPHRQLLNHLVDLYKIDSPDKIFELKKLYEDRKKPIIEKDIQWFEQFLQQQPLSQSSFSPSNQI